MLKQQCQSAEVFLGSFLAFPLWYFNSVLQSWMSESHCIVVQNTCAEIHANKLGQDMSIKGNDDSLMEILEDQGILWAGSGAIR